MHYILYIIIYYYVLLFIESNDEGDAWECLVLTRVPVPKRLFVFHIALMPLGKAISSFAQL